MGLRARAPAAPRPSARCSDSPPFVTPSLPPGTRRCKSQRLESSKLSAPSRLAAAGKREETEEEEEEEEEERESVSPRGARATARTSALQRWDRSSTYPHSGWPPF
ncbi:hypothetical protein AGIG_G8991 [Arapaima gigas]